MMKTVLTTYWGIETGAMKAMQELYNLNPKIIRQLRNHTKKRTLLFSNTNELQNTPDQFKGGDGSFY